MDFTLTAEQQDIIKAAREFAQGEFTPRAFEFDHDETFDLDLWSQACDLGFVGMFIPEEYGGPGFGFLEFCLANEEFWAVDPGISQAIMSTTFGSEMVLLYGTEEQKKRYLAPLCAGEAIIACAITEPDAGSDVTQAGTTAVRDGDEWVINGSKIFITNGTLASYAVVFCQTDPDNDDRHRRFSAIMVDTDQPGYQATKLMGKLGIRASDTAEISLNDVRAPVENLIGREGQGFYQIMGFLNHTRLHICAQGVGLARGCLERCLKHAKSRVQFGQPLAAYQATQLKLAEMATSVEAARLMYQKAAWLTDHGTPDHALVAMAKWFSARSAVIAADEAVQLHGGYGYLAETDVQRFYRDSKILEIYEGTREMEKLIVAREILGRF
jgi:alkylation response protein AidB-like acyl-CoA dehydrogenase